MKKAEIENIQNVHLKMFEFRKTTAKRHNFKSEDQSFNSLPYWLFATRSKLLRGLPIDVQKSATLIDSKCLESINDAVNIAIREYLLPKSDFREKFDDCTNKHFASFLKSLAFVIYHNPELRGGHGRNFFNQDVETVGFFGKDDIIYQVTDNATVAQIRSKEPVLPFELLESETCSYSEDEIPTMPHNMDHYEVLVWENQKLKMPKRSSQWIKKRIPVKEQIRNAEIFSGAKPGSHFPFHHTQFLLVPRSEEFWREQSEFYHQQVTDCKSLLNMHATLSSTAWYLKFTPFQDLSSPLGLNAITYDGTQNVAFYNYQLNTIAGGKMMLDEYQPEENNKRCNVLWSTELTPLFSYDETTDSVEINTEAVRCIVTLLSRESQEQTFKIPESLWDDAIPSGMPLVRIDRDVDPGKIWIKPKYAKNWPEGWHQPKYKWNPEYMARMEKEKDQKPYYDSTEDHSEFIAAINDKKKLLID